MTTPRHATSIFCDDVRQELGNKLSFMGVYRERLIVPRFPALLPRFFVVVTAVTPATRPFEALTFRLLKGDEVIAETEMEEALLSATREAALEETPADEERVISATAILSLSPFHADAPCRLRARVITEAEELKAGSLEVVGRETEGAAAADGVGGEA